MVADMDERSDNTVEAPDRLGLDSFLPSLSDTLRLRASVFFRLRMAAPWGMALGRTSDLRLHILQKGRGVLGGGDLEAPIELCDGEILLLKGGQEHWIADRPGRHLISSDDAMSACRSGQPPFQGGALTHKLLCGKATVHDRGGGWLLSLLPEIIHFREQDLDDRVWMIVRAIRAKAVSLEEDESAVLDRLTEALFLCLLTRATQKDLAVGRLGSARRDPAVQKTLALMHTMMEVPWTIQKLAKRAAISRAALARRFKTALGVPVIDYLNRIRMARAKELLLDGLSLGEVGDRVGYAGAEPFRKAFKRYTGITPAAYLRSRRTETALG